MSPKQNDLFDKKIIKSALKLWSNSQKLGQHPLAQLKIVELQRKENNYPDTLSGYGNALRVLLDKAIESLKPAENEPDKLTERWWPYIILTTRYIQHYKAKDIQEDYGIASSTYGRYHTKALKLLVDRLRKWEHKAAPVKPLLQRPVSDQMPQEEESQAVPPPVEPAQKSNVADGLSEQQKQEQAVAAVVAAESDEPVQQDEQDEQEQPLVLPPVKDLPAPLSEPPVEQRQDKQMERLSWGEIWALFQSKSRSVLVAAVVVFLLVFISVRLLSPQLAILYNEEGFKDYDAGELSSAKANYEWAIWWNPEYAEAHYNLGVLYEDWQEFEQAGTEYELAMKGGLDAAYNNLARLYIIRYEKYEEAVDLLGEGLDQAEKNEENNEVKYAMHKNLGWAQLKQEDYAAAESHLRAAIGLDSDKAPAYCLLAQVRDKQNWAVKALENWDKCLERARSDNLDEDEWIKMARERLNEGGE